MKEWFKKVFNAFIEARQAEANRRIAAMHLYRMTDRELNDIGIGRGDIKRIVYENEVETKEQSTNSKAFFKCVEGNSGPTDNCHWVHIALLALITTAFSFILLG